MQKFDTTPLNTAVLFLVFNRLDTTKQVFEAIKEAKPPRLYIAADGARETKHGESIKVKNVRDYIISNIDWNCEIKTLFRDSNLGCKIAVSGAIDWFFKNEEMGIILEDDCLPNQSFFVFCEKMLNKYKNNSKVNMITGTSYLFNEVETNNDYFFSRYISIWGWATWKDKWNTYDIKMKNYPEIKSTNFLDNFYFCDTYISNIFSKYFDVAYNNEIDTWDFQWVYKCVESNKLCITPYKNLVSNIGIEGTRSSLNSPFINMERVELLEIDNLKYDDKSFNNYTIDKILYHNVFYRFNRFSIIKKILNRMKNF